MAPRPFARHPKETAEEKSSLGEADEFAQFFSNDRHPEDPSTGDSRRDQLPAQEMPAIALEDHGGAGWYPDATDPGLMRYWDGFHLTGQVMHVHARAGEAGVEAPATATVNDDESATNSSQRSTDLQPPFRPRIVSLDELQPIAEHDEDATPPPPSPVWVGLESSDEPAVAATSPTEPVIGAEEAESEEAESEDEEAGAAVVTGVFKSDDRGGRSAASPTIGSSEDSSSREAVEVSHWAEKTEMAVARAREIGTPQAWQQAAQSAVVVSEIAQTLQAAADAKQLAADLDNEAQEAAQRANVAAQMASDADLAVQQSAKAAEQAAEAAKVAEQAAAVAKQTAEQAAEAAPKLAELARVAAKAATGADHKAQGLDEIVARASTANTAESWSEALRLSSEVIQTEQDPVSSTDVDTPGSH